MIKILFEIHFMINYFHLFNLLNQIFFSYNFYNLWKNLTSLSKILFPPYNNT